MNSQRKRVLVIGAGPSGLSLLRAFQQYEQKLQNFPIISCYEKQQQWGGQWNYFTKVKLDKFGLPIPSTNEYLWTNAPKECFEYPDYSFDQHFNGVQMPSYLPRQYLKEYFTKRFEKNDIKKFITFGTIVKYIKCNDLNKYFQVESQNLNTLQRKNQIFDYVVVASGHFAKPNIPNFDGLQQFKGKLIHSIQIKDYEDFKDEDILIVGTGLSAEDAVLQSYKYGAKSITVTYRTRPMSQKFPKQIDQFPLISKIQNKTVTFNNGQKRQFDTIILCTGYSHNFSFLDPEIRLEMSGKLWSEDLYMGIVLQKNPKIMYIGMQAQYFSFMMFDIQSYLIRDFVLEKFKLPSVNQMKKDGKNRAEFEKSIQNPYDIIEFMGKYMKEMMELAQYPHYNIDKVILLYIQLQRHKQSDIISFRDHIYASTVTGTWSIKRSQTWLESGAQFQTQQNLIDNLMKRKIEIEIKSSY